MRVKRFPKPIIIFSVVAVITICVLLVCGKERMKQEANIALSMIMLDKAEPPDEQEIVRVLKEQSPGILEMADVENDEGTISFRTEQNVVVIALMPVPIPWSEIEGPASTSWLWPNAEEILRNQKAHIIVTITSELDDLIEVRILLTRVTAAVLRASSNALGVYWGDGAVVNSRELFLDFADSMTRDELPLYLWVDFRIQKDKGGSLAVFTTGMEQFGHMELEMLNFKEDGQALLNRALIIAHYLLDNGPVLKDGDTIGTAPDEKLRIRHAPSILDEEKTVLRFEP